MHAVLAKIGGEEEKVEKDVLISFNRYEWLIEIGIPYLCEKYNFSLFFHGNDNTALMTIHDLELPPKNIFMPKIETEQGPTSFKFRTSLLNQQCKLSTPKKIIVECRKGSKIPVVEFTMLENETKIVNGLFPDTHYGTCIGKLLVNDSDMTQQTGISLKTTGMPHYEFTSHDTVITLAADYTDAVMLNPNFKVTIKIKDGDTNETIVVSAQQAVTHGITGLHPSEPYIVCLSIKQKNETCIGKCGEYEKCTRLATLPAMKVAENSVFAVFLGIHTLIIVVILVILTMLLRRTRQLAGYINMFEMKPTSHRQSVERGLLEQDIGENLT